MFDYPKKIELLEVGPRDGFQSVKEFIPTERKKQIIDRLVESGCRNIQVTSFVSPKAIPQLADAQEVGAYALAAHPQCRFTALTPNLRGVENARSTGFRMVNYVISVSPGHNMVNVRRTVEESFAELERIRDAFPEMEIGLEASTAFGCPFDGEVSLQQVEEYLGRARRLEIRHVDLCDTIGIADPLQIERTAEAILRDFPEMSFGIHIHDTRNMGIVNTLTAIRCGIPRVSTTVGGMGGSPFAPGAAGNTATEDLVFMLDRMGIETGIRFEKILDTALFLKENVHANYSSHSIHIDR